MDLQSPDWDIEPRPDGIKLQFVKDGQRVQVTLSEPEFYQFRQEANRVANQLVRDAARPLWGTFRKPRG